MLMMVVMVMVTMTMTMTMMMRLCSYGYPFHSQRRDDRRCHCSARTDGHDGRHDRGSGYYRRDCHRLDCYLRDCYHRDYDNQGCYRNCGYDDDVCRFVFVLGTIITGGETRPLFPER